MADAEPAPVIPLAEALARLGISTPAQRREVS
jgi:hypothetical protein